MPKNPTFMLMIWLKLREGFQLGMSRIGLLVD